MQIPKEIQTSITTASAKALATHGPAGINVVPVSVVQVNDQEIMLCDFFMKKTVENILAQPQVALTCWDGLAGVQIKATAAYHTSGAAFEAAQAEYLQQFPDRSLRGIILLTADLFYDVSADQDKAGQQIYL